MKIKHCLTLCIALLSLTACKHFNKPVHNPKIHHEVYSFKTVAKEVERLTQLYSKDEVLIVVDIDNTLLTSDIDLGGDIWYQWQRGKLEVKPTQEQKVECLFEDSIGLLYELGPMKLTENLVPQMITDWKSQGHTVFALTSRSPKYRAATERELNRHGINFIDSALRPKNSSIPVYSGTLDRAFSYIRGIMMTTGMNKGEMLQYILNRTNRHFKAIVFVDDSKKNIDNLFQAYQQTDVDMHLFSFTRIEDNRIKNQGSVLTQEQANKMSQQWDKINSTLDQIFPARDLKGTCLGR